VGIVTACCLSLHVLQRGQNHKGWRAFGQSTFCTFLQETWFFFRKWLFPMKKGVICLFFQRFLPVHGPD